MTAPFLHALAAPSHLASRLLAFSLVAAAIAAGCGEGGTKGAATGAAGSSDGMDDGSSADAGPTFLAFSSDFQGYTSWTKFDLGVVDPMPGELPGPHVLYLNRAPDDGSAQFPVGTIIVKAIGDGPPSTWQLFAMAKRGGGFNQRAAPGWEWFELTQTDDFVVAIQWRGLGPPKGEGYAGLTGISVCDECHAESVDNDYVKGDSILLTH